MKSWVDISKQRLVANLRAIQTAAGEDAEVLAVVKANGYGHDAALVANVLVESGLHWLGVSDVEEGLRVAGTARVLVMCGMEPADAPLLVHHNLTPVIWTVDHISALEQAAEAADKRTAVHLEIDTGMARQGVPPGPELDHVLTRLAASKWLTCEGVMSHLAMAEVANSVVTRSQQARFAAALQQLTSAGIHPTYIHLANTSAVDEASTATWLRDQARQIGAQVMVRTGLAIYGSALPIDGASGKLHPDLHPVLTWKTRIIGLRDLAPLTTVGYGATFTAPTPTRIALLPIGYADGFRREASSGLGNGWVILAGQRAPIVGRVSMNLTTVDVTSLPAQIGDEVILLGPGVTAEDHARWCNTIPYEILCGIRARFELA